MDKAKIRSKWYNWRMVALLLIMSAIYVRYYVLEEHDENAPVVMELDLSTVALKSEQEVEAVLGKGDRVGLYRDLRVNCEKCPKVIYKSGKIEVTFINEIADHILIHNLTTYDFNDRVILGLLDLKEDIEPNIDNKELKQWDNYQKYSQISAFGRGGKLQYILVKAKSL